MDYVLITDMTCDLNSELLEKYQITCIPMKFMLDGQEYTHYPDQREMSLSEFYKRLGDGASISTTQINPITYQEYLETPLKEGKDVVYICFTSGLSGTYNGANLIAAQLREEYPERRITVIDSLCASIGQGLLVILAGKKYVQGCAYEEMVEYLETTKTRCCHWFTVEDLHHLKRGGRLSSVEAVLGTALKIKPVLSVDREGKLLVVAKERGTKKAMNYLVNRLETDGFETEQGVVVIGHAGAPAYAEALSALVKDNPKVREVVITEIGPIIGAHVGAGMCALVFEGENYRF